MMTTLKDSSEIHEAARLFHELSKPVSQSPVLMLAPDEESQEDSGGSSVWLKMASVVETGEGLHGGGRRQKGARLEESMIEMCERGGFIGAVVAELTEFPVAVFRSGPGHQAVAALFSAYGKMLPYAMSTLKTRKVSGVSVAVSLWDKAVVRRFDINDIPHYLMVFCSKKTDERVEVESSISLIISTLAHEALINR